MVLPFTDRSPVTVIDSASRSTATVASPATLNEPPTSTSPSKLDWPAPFTVNTPPIIALPVSVTSNKPAPVLSTTSNTFVSASPAAIVTAELIVVLPLTEPPVRVFR